MAAIDTVEKYGLQWRANTKAINIELGMIRKGDKWLREHGTSLFYHHKEAQKLLWPADDHHRWSDLILKTICENDITVLMGPGDSGKTYGMIKFALTDWWSDPEHTLFIVSSTDMRGLELRIWGWMKTLFNQAKDRFEFLKGFVLESMHSITPEKIDDENLRGRVLNKGLVCVPCLSSTGAFSGLGKFVGVKQTRLRHLGDEVQHMKNSFLDAYNNWIGNPNFKGVMSGNPLDPTDQLGVASEPKDGWLTFIPPSKTETWRSKFFDAVVVNLVGSDSPNFDYPQDQPQHYRYLVGKAKLDRVAGTHGKDSWQYAWQCEGVMRPGLLGNRVISRELCRRHNAHETVVWSGEGTTIIYAVDPAYGGGDRCVGMRLEFGTDMVGKQRVKIYPPEIIPVSVKIEMPAEDQIAKFVHFRHTELSIPAQNIFYDSFGKGTLGFAFAKLFGANCPVPVDSGGRPTKRPVRFDLWVEDFERPGEKRLKRCDEHYSKFVSEMWFSVREAIESEQVGELPEDVMIEGCSREYRIVMGNKTEVEPKDSLIERTGKSPDLFDCLAIGVEGARQRGFKIQRIGISVQADNDRDWLYEQEQELEDIIKEISLTHA